MGEQESSEWLPLLNKNLSNLVQWELTAQRSTIALAHNQALYWSGFEAGQLNKLAFTTFLNAYKSHGGIIRDNCEDVLNWGFGGKLGWLEYNLKRSLGMESSNSSEIILGTNEAVSTLLALEEYASLIPTLNQWLVELET